MDIHLLKHLAKKFRDYPQRRRYQKSNVEREMHGFPVLNYAGQSPNKHSHARGGRVKLITLSEEFPENSFCFNILYLVSSALPRGVESFAEKCKSLGIKIVLNQNGLTYPGWYGPGWHYANVQNYKILKLADFVFYQTAFCKQGVFELLGDVKAPYEIVFNPVDTNAFVPRSTPLGLRPLKLLLGGSQYQWYRVECALEALKSLINDGIDATLTITGELCWEQDYRKANERFVSTLKKLDIIDKVILYGKYTQNEAPKIFQEHHILIHPKYNDPCPTVVLEAMSSGLPIAFSHSGGLPELVGNRSGIGVLSPHSWVKDHPPDPISLASCVREMLIDLPGFSRRAREHAVKSFAKDIWIAQHRRVFTNLSISKQFSKGEIGEQQGNVGRQATQTEAGR